MTLRSEMNPLIGGVVLSACCGIAWAQAPPAAPRPAPLVFAAHVETCHDGDSCDVTLHLGLGLELRDKIRLGGIQAPELFGVSKAAGIISRDRLCARICSRDVVVALEPSRGRDKYGRLLGVIWLGGENVNAWLVAEQLAIAWDGTGARP